MKIYDFDQIIVDCTSKLHKIKKEDYLSAGKYRIIDQSKEFITGYTNDESLISELPYPIIVFGDHTKIFKYVDFPLALGADGAKALAVNNNLAISKYIYYYLKSIKLQDAGYSRHFKFLREVRIQLPENFDDQIRIVTILEKVETLIGKRKKGIIELDELLRSTFLELFGNPIRNEKKWAQKELKQFGDIITGNTPPRNDKENYTPSFIEWIKTDNIIENETYLTIATEYLSEKGLTKARFVNPGALLVACIAGSTESIGRAAIASRQVSFNQQINAIQPNDKIDTIFLYWLLKISKPYIQSYATKGMKKILTKGDFERINMICPPYALQCQFASTASKVEALKAKYKQSLIEMEYLYNSISECAFKGELKLSKIPVALDIDIKYESLLYKKP